jgi:hypothetical protein
MKKLKLFLGIIGLFAIAIACSDDDGTSTNKMDVFGTASYTTPTSKNNLPLDIILTSFKINVTDLTLKYYEDDNVTGRDDGHDYIDIAVAGPWELDLLNQKISIATVNVPNGNYKKAVLHLSKSLKPSSPIYNKTVEIRGFYNGTPFVFWHDFDQSINIGYDDEFEEIVVNNNSIEWVFNFDLNDLIDSIDLTDAVDGDADGVIEISPADPDGNHNLAALLDQHIGHCGGIEHQD